MNKTSLVPLQAKKGQKSFSIVGAHLRVRPGQTRRSAPTVGRQCLYCLEVILRYAAKWSVVVVLLLAASFARPQSSDTAPISGDKVQCANLIYAGNKSSQCFSDRFLKRLEMETRIKTEPHFARSDWTAKSCATSPSPS